MTGPTGGSGPGAAALECARCQRPLLPSRVVVKYLGHEFPVELPRCPGCGAVHVPEALATGKMLQVEELLEDK